jgi:autotransporter-associated beta strand protein
MNSRQPRNSKKYCCRHLVTLRCLCAVLSAVVATGKVSAQSQLTWDNTPGTAGVQDGSGAWSTGGPNWLNTQTGTNVNWPGGTGTTAVFGNGTTGPATASRTVTVGGTVGVAGMVFNPATNDAAYVFNSGTIQFADGALVSVGNGATGISGNKRLTFNSILTGSNVTIAKTASSNASALGAFVQLNGANTWTGTLSLLDLVNNGSDGLFVQATAASVTSLDRIVIGDRVTMTLATVGNFNADMEIGTGSSNRGAIRFDANATVTGDITMRSNSSISTNNSALNIGTISGNITEAVAGTSLTLNSNTGAIGTIVLGGNNSFTGGVILLQGTARLNSTGALNSATPNLFTFGPTTVVAGTVDRTLQLNGNSVAVGGLTLGNTGNFANNFVENANAAAATLTIKNRFSFTFSGVIRDGTGGGALSLTKTGTGTQTLTAANTYTGNTTITAGILALNFGTTASNVVNNTANSSALIMQGGTLQLNGGATVANSQRFNGLTVQSGSSTIQLVQNATTPQELSLSLGAITRTGGYMNFILPNGTQSATNGIITTNGAGMLGTWATVNGEDWASVNASGNIVAFTGYQTVTNFSTGPGALGPIPNNPAAHVKIVQGGDSGSVQLANPNSVTDIASLVVDATGPTVIKIVSLFDGLPEQQGTLRVGAEGAIMLAAGAGELAIGETPDFGGKLTAGGADNTAGTLVISNYSTNAITVNADIVDNGDGVVTLVKNGSGTLILTSGAVTNGTIKTYSGGTVINGGTIRIGNDLSLGTVPTSFDADNLTFNGGALQFSASLTLSSNRGVTLLAGGGTFNTAVGATNFNVSYNGVISGTGDLIKTGGSLAAGTLTLGGANTYTGETVISAGAIILINNQALGSTAGGTVVASGGMLRLTNGINVVGETLTINGNGNNNGALNLIGGANVAATASATWTGDIAIGTLNSRIGVNDFGTLTLSGKIRDGGSTSVQFSSTGTGGVVLLTNNSVYTGTTGIIRGTLKLGVDNALPTGTILTVYTANSVTETTAFDLNGQDQTIAGLNSVVPVASSDVVIVTNANVSDASTLTVNQATDQVYNGKITGNLALTKSGTGKLTLTNTYNTTTPTASTSTYTGKTTISGGTLALTGTGNIQGTPWVQIDQGATFDVALRTGGGYDLTNKTLSGSGSVTGNLTISGTSIIKPGGNAASAALAQAGSGTGTLTINGNLTLAAGGTRSLLNLGGTNSSLFDPLSGGNAEFFDNASAGGRYDQLDINGTLNLNASGTIKVEFVDGYVASAGDVFNLLDWLALGAGNTFTLADLDLSAVASWGGGLHFETDKFLSHGIIYVAVPEPSRALLVLTGIMWCGLRRRRKQR